MRREEGGGGRRREEEGGGRRGREGREGGGRVHALSFRVWPCALAAMFWKWLPSRSAQPPLLPCCPSSWICTCGKEPLFSGIGDICLPRASVARVHGSWPSRWSGAVPCGGHVTGAALTGLSGWSPPKRVIERVSVLISGNSNPYQGLASTWLFRPAGAPCPLWSLAACREDSPPPDVAVGSHLVVAHAAGSAPASLVWGQRHKAQSLPGPERHFTLESVGTWVGSTDGTHLTIAGHDPSPGRWRTTRALQSSGNHLPSDRREALAGLSSRSGRDVPKACPAVLLTAHVGSSTENARGVEIRSHHPGEMTGFQKVPESYGALLVLGPGSHRQHCMRRFAPLSGWWEGRRGDAESGGDPVPCPWCSWLAACERGVSVAQAVADRAAGARVQPWDATLDLGDGQGWPQTSAVVPVGT